MHRNTLTPRSARDGFTLIELMIVIAIVGILAGVAVPQFRSYQMNSKRTEALTNLQSLAVAQKAYFGERGAHIGVPAAEPGQSLGNAPSEQRRDVAPLAAAFANLGWTPDGNVYYDYDAIGSQTENGLDGAGCSCGPA